MNYQRALDQIIADWQQEGRVPHLLLHSCCAPCSSYVLEYLSRYCRITVYYYNPNITTADEYRHRADEVRRLIDTMNAHMSSEDKYPIQYLEGEYQPRVYIDAVRGFEHEPEGGKRCEICFRLRLQDAARVAQEIGADYFTTSLTISPLKDAELLNNIGKEQTMGHLQWLPSDFKKRGGYLRSIQLSKDYNLYRQNYCGCIYSQKNK